MFLLKYVLILSLPSSGGQKVNEDCGNFKCSFSTHKLVKTAESVYCLETASSRQPKPMFLAKIQCDSENIALPIPESKEENQELYNSIHDVFGPPFKGLIALQGERKNGKFVKNNGEELTYFNWVAGAPTSNSKQNYIGKIFTCFLIRHILSTSLISIVRGDV